MMIVIKFSILLPTATIAGIRAVSVGSGKKHWNT